MLKAMGAAAALSLLVSCYCCSASLPSSLLAVLVVLLSSSFPFILSKIKQLHHAGKAEEFSPEEVDAHENNATEEDDACGVPSVPSDCSEGSISDDDNLIEITLPDGHYAGQMSEVLLRDFSPESVFRQHEHGLKELFSEINEEDNLIEIDINVGSIKCSRFGIRA